MNLLREPDAGDPHVRFDEREVETERFASPRHLSTPPFSAPNGSARDKALLAPWPVRRSPDWLAWVNEPQTPAEEQAIQTSIKRGRPFGDDTWQRRTADVLDLETTLAPRGRPRMQPKGTGIFEKGS